MQTPPIQQRLLCPQSHECRKVALHIRTNRDLVNGLSKTQQALQFCITENQALKHCIEQHNKQ
ncbi:Rz1-like lysis system protein LysC [Mergibacter septicus]|uniref:Rz1-like lysis system protein LysC n=1 Tax=Mergibacter septicus TaxID=221402 RepID=UPI0021C40C0E|nr:Rz1-like lysis system protein LysC [Mergibacter septicus]